MPGFDQLVSALLRPDVPHDERIDANAEVLNQFIKDLEFPDGEEVESLPSDPVEGLDPRTLLRAVRHRQSSDADPHGDPVSQRVRHRRPRRRYLALPRKAVHRRLPHLLPFHCVVLHQLPPPPKQLGRFVGKAKHRLEARHLFRRPFARAGLESGSLSTISRARTFVSKR